MSPEAPARPGGRGPGGYTPRGPALAGLQPRVHLAPGSEPLWLDVACLPWPGQPGYSSGLAALLASSPWCVAGGGLNADWTLGQPAWLSTGRTLDADGARTGPSGTRGSLRQSGSGQLHCPLGYVPSHNGRTTLRGSDQEGTRSTEWVHDQAAPTNSSHRGQFTTQALGLGCWVAIDRARSDRGDRDQIDPR